jgi:ribosomal protein S18 acetylase RimI-like enzyme
MGDRLEQAAALVIRAASSADASGLALMCRRCFRKSPEWYGALFLVRRWWRGLIADPAFVVEVVVQGDRMVGYLVTTDSHTSWRGQLQIGPHRRVVKLFVMLTRPSFLKSKLNKRLRSRKPSRSAGNGQGLDHGGEGARSRSRVTADGVRDGRRGLYLAIMAMDPEIRGIGGGKRLVERFIELGQVGEYDYLWLHVDPRNERAQGLYGRYGFVIEGVDGSNLLMTRPVGGASG